MGMMLSTNWLNGERPVCSEPSVIDTIDQRDRVMDSLNRLFHPSAHYY